MQISLDDRRFSTAKTALGSAKRTLEEVRSVAGKRIKELLIGHSPRIGRDEGDLAATAQALMEIEELGQWIPDISLPLQVDLNNASTLAVIFSASGGDVCR